MREQRWKRSITSVPEFKNSLITFFFINILVKLYKLLYCVILYKYAITYIVYLASYLNFLSQHWNINISCVVLKPLNSVLNNYMIAQQMYIAYLLHHAVDWWACSLSCFYTNETAYLCIKLLCISGDFLRLDSQKWNFWVKGQFNAPDICCKTVFQKGCSYFYACQNARQCLWNMVKTYIGGHYR